MGTLSNLITEFNNQAEKLSDETVLLLARWVTRITTIFGLDPKGDLNDPGRIRWSGLDIPGPAKPYAYLASQLRDDVRALARSGSVDHGAIARLAEEITSETTIPVTERSRPYDQVLRRFCTEVRALAGQQVPAKDLLALCDQLRDTHLWNLGIYLEDRSSSRRTVVRPLGKLLVEARAEQAKASAAKEKAKLEREAQQAGKEKELREAAKIDPSAHVQGLKRVL